MEQAQQNTSIKMRGMLPAFRFLAATSLLFIVFSMQHASYVHAQQGQVYVPIQPCRIVDTRQSADGLINAGSVRNFKVTGSAAELAEQGGQVDCVNPRSQSPIAVVAYVIAVATDDSANGNLFAFPSDTLPPSGSTVNFREGENIGNTSIISLCESSCPAQGPLALRANVSEQHVVIDVQGYFYPENRKGYVWANDPAADEYIAEGIYAFNSKNGEISISRVSSGRYIVLFEELADGVIDGNVMVNRYGPSPGICTVDNWESQGSPDLRVEVRCFDLSGTPQDAQFTVLFNGGQ